jgi:hypothetical protein
MSKPRLTCHLGINPKVTCLLVGWHPAYRWHDLYRGFYMELGNLSSDAKGDIQVAKL